VDVAELPRTYDRAMRIVHIEAGRHLYGGAVQVRYLLDGLSAAGGDNVLVCARGSELAAAPPAAAVVELPMRGELDVALLPRLVRVLRAAAPDLVHVHSRRGADLYGGLAAALAGVPAVLTRRVDAAEPAWFARFKYRPYAAVVALSAAIDAQVAAGGVEASRRVRIPSAVDTQRFRPDPAAHARLRAAFGLPHDAVVVGVVAQLIPRKRHAWLLELLPELMRREPRLHVLCFGRGPLEAELRAVVAARGLAPRVQLAGCRGDLPALVAGCDVVAHPAAREGLGVALLEAASAAVPVVACAVGGVPDVLVDGETGLLVARDDAAGFAAALGQLVANAELRHRLGAAARRRAERQFGVAALVGAHRDLYARLASAAAPAASRAVWR
jgi:glycosyltransferase involved in cell wall biosynthesis